MTWQAWIAFAILLGILLIVGLYFIPGSGE